MMSTNDLCFFIWEVTFAKELWETSSDTFGKNWFELGNGIFVWNTKTTPRIWLKHKMISENTWSSYVNKLGPKTLPCTTPGTSTPSAALWGACPEFYVSVNERELLFFGAPLNYSVRPCKAFYMARNSLE